MGDTGQTIDALQGQALQTTMTRLDTMYEIIVGNGNPEKGLSAQVLLLKRDIDEIKKQQQQNEITRAAQLSELKTMILEDRATRARDSAKTNDRAWDMSLSLIKTVVSAAIGAAITLMVTGRISIHWCIG
jgi:hypothetical protein